MSFWEEIVDDVLKVFKPIESLTESYYDNNYLFYGVVGIVLLFIMFIVYLVFFWMVKIQIKLPEDVNKKVKHFMIDKNFIDKRIAIVCILRKFFKEIRKDK